MKPDITIPITILSRRAGIYAWRRGSEYLYIGQSLFFIRRLISHHVIKGIKLQSDDMIDVWFCCPSELATFEARMINKYKPRYNKAAPKIETKFDSFRDSFAAKTPPVSNKVAEYIAKYGPLKR